MEPDVIPYIKEYRRIKETFDKFRETRGIQKEDKLTINVEEIRKNVRRSLVIKKYNDKNNPPRTL